MSEITPIDFTQKTLNMPEVPCYYQYDLFKNTIETSVIVNGLYLEFGLFVGNTAKQICEITQDKILYGFESFQGQEISVVPNEPIGSNKYIGELPKYHSNVRIVMGRLQESLPMFLKQHTEDIAYANFDVSANGVYDGLSILADYKRLKKGTSLTILHAVKEYNNQIYDSIYKAFIEFIEQYKIEFRYVGFGDVHLALVLTKNV